MKKVSISTITPVYTGEAYLPDLISKIEQIRDKWKSHHSPVEVIEAIFVNDEAPDRSLDVLYEIQKNKSWIKIINLSRNFGQHQATVAGILYSSGDWIVTLDEDLQHDPSHIDTMLASAVRSGADVMYATPEQSVHGNLLRDMSSSAFKSIVSYLTGNPHVRNFSSFRLIRGNIARATSSICSHGPYFDIALCWFTDRISTIRLPLKDIRFINSRKSGYTIRKLFSHAKRMIVSSETKIIRLGASIGLIAMVISLIVSIKILFEKLLHPASIPVQGWTSLFLTILFFGGLLALMSGILLEYISVILLHTQGKPTFFIVDRRSDRTLLDYFHGDQSK